MEEYTIRKATLNDLPFIADVILAAEKGVSSKLSYSTLFDLPEAKVKELIVSMLDEEIDGCEFSVSSYLITEFEGQPVAGLGGWIEGFYDGESSKILKSNLLSFTFPKESIKALISNSDLISSILIDRTKMTLQLEYGYVLAEHRSKRLLEPMIHMHVNNAKQAYPDLKQIQFQCFKNSVRVVSLFTKLGYELIKEVEIENDKILEYLPDRTKLLMEKKL